MLFNQVISIILKRILVFGLILFNCFAIYSQAELSEEQIQAKLLHIEEQITAKKYDEAWDDIQVLESTKSFPFLEQNKLRINLAKAKVFYSKGEKDRSMDILLKNFSIVSTDYKEKKLYKSYTEFLGVIFFRTKNYERALYYYRLTKANALIRNDSLDLALSDFKIGITHYYDENNDSARYYYLKVVGYKVTNENYKIISSSYLNLSALSINNNDYVKANEYQQKSYQMILAKGDTIGMASTLVNIGGISYKGQEFTEAKKKYTKAFELVQNNETERAFKMKRDILFNLAYVNEELNDYEKAYHYLEKATDLKDSLAEANVAQNISEIEAKFNVAKEAQKTAVEKSKRQKTQFLFFGTLAVFLMAVLLGYIFYRNYRLKQRNKLEQLENEVHTKIINATIDAKEKERKAIAETLHDNVSALLSSANLHLQATKAQLRKEAPKEITKAQTIVNEASVKIRDLSHELISSVLLKFGLAFAVHDMCQKYSNSRLSLLSDDNGIKRYEQDFEIKIHNIIEELINNILKHSNARNATIMLVHRADDKLGIRINDDGVGFDMKKAKQKDGLGLSHINARIKIMKGVFTVETSINNGTSIFILVPIQFKEALV